MLLLQTLDSWPMTKLIVIFYSFSKFLVTLPIFPPYSVSDRLKFIDYNVAMTFILIIIIIIY